VDPHLGHSGASTLVSRPSLRRQRPEDTGRDHPEGVLRKHEGDECGAQGGPGDEFPAARTASLLAGSVMSVGKEGQAVRARRHQTPSICWSSCNASFGTLMLVSQFMQTHTATVLVVHASRIGPALQTGHVGTIGVEANPSAELVMRSNSLNNSAQPETLRMGATLRPSVTSLLSAADASKVQSELWQSYAIQARRGKCQIIGGNKNVCSKGL
jgi:hypothetical protein